MVCWTRSSCWYISWNLKYTLLHYRLQHHFKSMWVYFCFHFYHCVLLLMQNTAYSLVYLIENILLLFLFACWWYILYSSPVMKKHPSGSQARKKRKALEQITNQSQIKRFLVGTSHPTCSNSISRNDTSPKHSNNMLLKQLL